jgi:hypothetical protein
MLTLQLIELGLDGDQGCQAVGDLGLLDRDPVPFPHLLDLE